MPVEMSCGSCEGRFLVSAAGTVACPHCGAHVLVSADVFSGAKDQDVNGSREPAADAQPEAHESQPGGLSASDSPEPAAENPPLFADEAAAGEDDPSGDSKTITVAEFNRTGGGTLDDDPVTEMFTAPNPVLDSNENEEQFPDFDGPADEPSASDIDALLDSANTKADVSEDRPPLSEQPVPPAVTPIRTTAGYRGQRGQVGAVRSGVPVTWFVILASYASAVTIVCLYLLFAGNYDSSQLENLKDPAEAPAEGETRSVTLYKTDLRMPPSHELRLGESRRYGNIVIEPLKVTRGPLEFVHFAGEERDSRPPSQPVLKLWLRFKNASDDQTIAPLDSVLLFTNRVRDEQDYEKFHANIFVCRREEKKPDGRLLHVYDLNVNDRWDLKGQDLGRELQPGESLVTYIPTSEQGHEQLKGDLVWRVHFRKGYAPSGRGVTTLVEVKFNSRSIRTEPAEEATASL